MTAIAATGAGREPVKYLLIATISLFWGLNWPAVKTILTQVPIFSLRAIGFTAGVSSIPSSSSSSTSITSWTGCHSSMPSVHNSSEPRISPFSSPSMTSSSVKVPSCVPSREMW